MSDLRQKKRSSDVTRRAALLGAPAVTLGALAVGFGLSRSTFEAPVAVGNTGPFQAVYLAPRDDQSHVDAFLVYPFGERHNPYAEGLAHYLEHLAWENLSEDAQDKRNHSNALTSPEATGYWLSRSPKELSNVVTRLAATAKPLTVTKEYADQERDIVQREYDLRVLENPLNDVWVDATRALYGRGPFARATIGTKASINTFTLDSAKRLHDETHQLPLATLLLRGPISNRDVERAIASADAWPQPRKAPLRTSLPLWPATTFIDLETRVLPKVRSEEVIVRRSYLSPEGFQPAEAMAARNVLEHLALSTKAGSLARPLRYDNFLSSSFDFGLYPLGQTGYEMWLTATPDASVSPEILHAAVENEIEALLSRPNQKSFAEIKERELDDLEGVLDPLADNDDRLFEATLHGLPFVTLSDLWDATASMTYARFAQFTDHFRTPRSSVVRLVTKTFS